jgi:hypothetical protein
LFWYDCLLWQVESLFQFSKTRHYIKSSELRRKAGSRGLQHKGKK